jgi:hypothetical protein
MVTSRIFDFDYTGSENKVQPRGCSPLLQPQSISGSINIVPFALVLRFRSEATEH